MIADAAADLGGEREPLVVGAARHHPHGVVEERLELDLLGIEPDAAGLDLRHVEDVVDDLEQVLAALVDVAAIFAIAVGAERAEHARLHDLGEADDGVERRAQLVAHIGEEFRLGLVRLLGPGLLLGIFLGQVGELVGLALERLLRLAQVGDRRHQPLLAVHQLFFVRLECGDVGADRHVAAVLGAPLADMQPAAVVELRLEGAGARALAFAGHLRAHHRLAARRHHGFVGGAGLDRLVRQVVQLLEVRVAQHHAVLRVPQHECLRDRLDGVAQAQIGLDRALDQGLLLGDVDRDADQVRAAVAGLVHQLAARAQPHPVAAGMAHAEVVVDRVGLGVGQLARELVEMDVLRVHELVDLAEAQQLVARLEPQDREHGMRPEDAAAGEVPVPQAATAAVERGVDALAHRLVDHVGLARARRLPVEGEAEDQHHEPGGGRERDGQRRVGEPGGERVAARMHHRDARRSTRRGCAPSHRPRCRRRAEFPARRPPPRRW